MRGAYVKLVGGLCVLSVLVSPLTGIVQEAVDYLDDDMIFNKLYGDSYTYEDASVVFEHSLNLASKSEIERGVVYMVCCEYELESGDVEAYVELGENGINRVSILLGGRAVFVDPQDIIGYVQELLGCRCEIIYGKKEK